MANRGDDRWHPHDLRRAVVTAELTLLLPLAAAAAALALDASALTVFGCVAAATTAAAVLCAAIARSVGARIDARHRWLQAERSDWESKALTDPLTAIANRRGIDARARLIEQRHRGVAWTVVAFDVDHFKTINDFHGHQVGDRALVLLAETLRDCCPDGAWVGRLGGDEFVAFTNAADVLTDRWANDLRAELARRTLKTREGSLWLSLTYGREVGAPGQPFAEVCDAADASLIGRKAARRASTAGVIGLSDAEVEAMRRRAESR